MVVGGGAMLHLERVLVGNLRSVPEWQMLACCLSRMLPVAMLCLGFSLVWTLVLVGFVQHGHEQHRWDHIAERAPPVLRQRALETPTVGLEPTTTRLRALRSAD